MKKRHRLWEENNPPEKYAGLCESAFGVNWKTLSFAETKKAG